MENGANDALRSRLSELLQRQRQVLETRKSGAATDSEVLEYELRQELIHDICEQLGDSAVN